MKYGKLPPTAMPDSVRQELELRLQSNGSTIDLPDTLGDTLAAKAVDSTNWQNLHQTVTDLATSYEPDWRSFLTDMVTNSAEEASARIFRGLRAHPAMQTVVLDQIGFTADMSQIISKKLLELLELQHMVGKPEPFPDVADCYNQAVKYGLEITLAKHLGVEVFPAPEDLDFWAA